MARQRFHDGNPTTDLNQYSFLLKNNATRLRESQQLPFNDRQSNSAAVSHDQPNEMDAPTGTRDEEEERSFKGISHE